MIEQTADTYGYRLLKDAKNTLYIWDGSDENSLVTITDEWGGNPTFDHSHNWGAGTSTSSAIAAEGIDSNSDGTVDYYQIAVKKEGKDNWGSWSDWEILKVSSTGVINWSETSWTQDIALYEGAGYFNQDLDGDGAQGINFSGLTTVGTGGTATDTTGDLLKKDSGTGAVSYTHLRAHET